MNNTLDGDYQTMKAEDGGFIREYFFNRDPRTAAMVADWTDDEIWGLYRGGHDYTKLHAAYAAALAHKGRPTVVLAKTVKGYGLGEAGEGKNITHQQKKLNEEELREFRTRFNIPLSDDDVVKTPFYKRAG